jgi:hypothetical protein
MNIDCCKSYVGKQIIGLLPGGAEECLYVLVINAQDFGGDTNFIGWTLNGNDFLTEIQNYVDYGINYNNDQGSQTFYGYYTGTTPTDLNITTNASGEIPFTIRIVTDYEGASCGLVCYQASFDYGFQWRFIDFFTEAPASPYNSPSAYNIDDATNLQYFASGFLGSQITVTSVWNGSQYVVTINNALNLGGFKLGDGNPVYTSFTALPCEIVPPTPVPLALLDIYGPATAAYSVRKLSSFYVGSAIRVRRSSDNTEQDIGFVGIDLDTTALSSFVGAGNGFVTVFYDQTGNGKHKIQTISTQQPRIVNSGSIELVNGKPAIYFDGINDYVETNASINIGTTISSFTVARLTRNHTSYSRLINGKKDQIYYIGTDAAENIVSGYGNNFTWSAITANSVTTWLNTQRIVTSLNNGTDSQFVNGVAKTPRAAAMAAFNNTIIIGGMYYNGINVPTYDQAWQGTVQEYILFNSYTSTIRVGMETNIINYFAI